MIIVRATNINVFQVTLSCTISDCYFLNDVFDRVTSSYVRKFIFLEYVDLWSIYVRVKGEYIDSEPRDELALVFEDLLERSRPT